ncbi:MAG TPA: hypothetical protein VLU25_20065 [Acidobacteriota bacterium]|nr:hypothetical protein [Acidobacteriota bacterium]
MTPQEPATHPTGKALLFLAFCLLLMLSAGCASVRSGPFEQFAKSTQALQSGVDQALQVGPEDAESRFLTEATQDPSQATDLRLLVDPSNPFTYKTDNTPMFLTAKRFHTGVVDATGVLADYGKALLQLASPDLLSPQQFDQLASDINSSAISAVTAISGSDGSGAARSVGLISTAATAIFKQYLESKRKKALVRGLRENQPTVEAYARHLVEATKIAADLAWTEYDAKAQDQLNKIVEAGAGSSQVTSALQQLIKLDEEHIAQLEVLKSLRDSFSAIPASHNGLIEAAKNPKSGLEAISLIIDRAQSLEKLYDRSVRENQATVAQQLAQQAQVRASLADSRASTAESKAALAQQQAELLRGEANLSPDDSQKQAAAEAAEKTAQQLADAARQLRQTATEAKQSAEAAQQVADRLSKQAKDDSQ